MYKESLYFHSVEKTEAGKSPFLKYKYGARQVQETDTANWKCLLRIARFPPLQVTIPSSSQGLCNNLFQLVFQYIKLFIAHLAILQDLPGP